MKTGSRAGASRHRREHPTSSRSAAAAWLRSWKRPRRDLRLFIEALKYAKALKDDEADRRRRSRAQARREARAKKRVLELANTHPDLFTVEIKDNSGESWGIRYTQWRVDVALRAYPRNRVASTRLTRAVGTFSMEIGKIPLATVAPVVLALISRAVRIKRPSGLQAAVLAVMAGIEPAAPHPHQQAEAERRWRARFTSAATNSITRQALFDHPLGEKYALIFEGDRLVPRRGRQTGHTTG